MADKAQSPSKCPPMAFPAMPTNFSEHDAKALADLTAMCEENDLYWPVSKLEDHPAHGSNNNVDLLRFLRARYFDPKAAYEQYSTSATWRWKCNLDDTYDNVDIKAFERMTRVQPQWTGRRDKQGIPIMMYDLAAIPTTTLSEIFTSDPNLTSIFLPAEYVTRFTQRLCTRLPHADNATIIDQSTNIIDLTGMSIRKFWTLRSILQTASNMATAHYPETVAHIFVLGAPYFFPMIWSLITRWFDAATTKKISVLSAATAAETLLKFIDKKDLPRRYGGEFEWEAGMQPVPDEEMKGVIGRMGLEWVEGPIRYISKPEGDVLMAVGSVDGKARREVLAEIPRVEATTPEPVLNGLN